MCSELDSLWRTVTGTVPVTRGGTSFNVPSKTTYGSRVHSWDFPNIANIMAATLQRTSRLSHAQATSIASMCTTTPICQDQSFEKSNHQMNSWNPLANPATCSTTSSNRSLDTRNVVEIVAAEETDYFHAQVAEPAGDDADADADSEAESDTSQFFDSDSEDSEGPEDDEDDRECTLGDEMELGTYGWSGYGDTMEGASAVDNENDTIMANMDTPSSPVIVQTSAYANLNKKPRRSNLSQKHSTQRSIASPLVLRKWVKGTYNPMYLENFSTAGNKRAALDPEENSEGDKAVAFSSETEVERRHIKLPLLSPRKRAWKASQGTRSSVGESEGSLTVNYHPMPQSSGSNAGGISTPPVTPAPIKTTKPMNTARRSTQPKNRPNLALALDSLGKLRVEDPGRRPSTGGTIATALTNELSPRMSSDHHEQKRTRYQQPTSSEIGNMAVTEGNFSLPVFWDATLEDSMDFKPSGVDGQWDTPGFGVAGAEARLSPAMDRTMDVSERAKGITRVMGCVDDLL